MTTPATQNSRNPQRLQRCILNLAYRPGGITLRQLAKLLGLGLSDVSTCIYGLLMDGRLFETRTDRQTSYHTAVVHLDPGLEQAGVTQPMVSYLDRGGRSETAQRLAQQFGLAVAVARANLERAVVNGLLGARNVGSLRLYTTESRAT
ncbi:hypothetical protein [Deinococcus multiflagellatus]|uniref:Uncharacterized protein n=1 Tax=Deinococcus multiflagellatus TaxID=1656887 RepID=A0ABW1ZQN6_9DEIO|nr:hypothetical protein [Deinococcus multiflagellatus]MBZ9714892.1 hypothetical protein [Deinococcus multiflagellatus]